MFNDKRCFKNFNTISAMFSSSALLVLKPTEYQAIQLFLKQTKILYLNFTKPSLIHNALCMLFQFQLFLKHLNFPTVQIKSSIRSVFKITSTWLIKTFKINCSFLHPIKREEKKMVFNSHRTSCSFIPMYMME